MAWLANDGDAVLNAVESWIERNGYPPSVREIGEMVGLRSTSTVAARLDGLRDAGLITYKDRQSRTIVVTKDRGLGERRAEAFIAHEVGEYMPGMEQQAKDLLEFMRTGDGAAVMRPSLSDAT